MPGRISRRRIAEYVATELIEGKTSKAKVLQQLAAFLVDTRRTAELTLIVRDIEYHLSEKGHINAIVTTAFDLTAETQKAIETFVKSKTKADHISLSALVDPSVLGGVKVSLPGYEINQTIAHQLTALKTRFKKA